MNRAIRCLAVVFAFLTLSWVGLSTLGRPAPQRPDPATLRAVDALVTDDAAYAAAAIPASFRTDEGYAPTRVHGVLLRATGGCSGPQVLPADFATVCKRHDLGYDLLRFAALQHGALPGSARRAIDAQLARGMDAVCATRTTSLERVGCRARAELADVGIGINSVRQHWSTPGQETARTWTALAVGIGAALSGLTLLVLLGRRIVRLARPALVAAGRRVVRLGRVVTDRADAGWVVSGTAVVAGLFPSHLPHAAVTQAVTALVFVALVHPLARRVSGRRLPGVALVAAALIGVGVLGWEAAQQNGVRAASSLPPVGIGHWIAVAAVIALGMTLPGLLRRLGRTPTRRWRPIVAVVAAGSVLTAAAPAGAAPTTAAAGSSDYVLLSPSPVGAVRAYAAIRPGEALTARAERAADDLVAAGGLNRDHVVIMLPTGSGWVDPAAVRGLESRFGSEVAEVGIQSTSVPSWVAFLAERGRSTAGARALYAAVEARIAALPRDRRPQLHVWGESLGASSGQAIFAATPTGDAARATLCSALWVGSPGGHRAGLARESLVSNPTDPVVHTALRTAVLPPGDGRPWLPVVSFVQSGVDFVSSRSGPVGTGHVYGPDQADALQTC